MHRVIVDTAMLPSSAMCHHSVVSPKPQVLQLKHRRARLSCYTMQVAGDRRSSSSSSASSRRSNIMSSSSSSSPVGQVLQGQKNYFDIDRRPVILFDGVCNLCNGGVNFVLDWDPEGVYRFAALQSTPGRELLMRCGRQPDDISSIVLVEEDRCYIKSEAVLRIATRLNMPFPLLAALALPLPKELIRDPLYDQMTCIGHEGCLRDMQPLEEVIAAGTDDLQRPVANNRYVLFGKQLSCRLSDARFTDRFLGA